MRSIFTPKILALVLLLSFYTLNPSRLLAQDVIISTPQLMFENDSLIIRYGFEDCYRGEFFKVWIEATTMDGEILSGSDRSLSGDLGDNIECGADKIIFWDFEADEIFLSEEINVVVMARPDFGANADWQAGHKNYFFSSLLFPGSGLGRLKQNGKPYWLMGVAGYAGLATTIAFTEKMNNDPATADQSRQIAGAAAITTGVIWVTNLVWTTVAVKKAKKNGLIGERLRLDPVVMPLDYTAGLSLKYSF